MAAPKQATRRGESSAKSCQVSIWVLVLSNLLVFQIGYHQNEKNLWQSFDVNASSSVDSSTVASEKHVFAGYALAPREGKAEALPSIRIDKGEDETERSIYGGKGDKKHLGGFVDIDLMGVSPAAWKQMLTFFGIKSIMDVGCGRGISTSWFYLHGVDALCLEGSHDAVLKTMLPHPETQIVEHDFSRGPWWPDKTYDAVWCVEFLEHVGRNFHQNYFAAFRKSALIFATHSRWGGWHHVEVHDDMWWIHKFEMYGFIYHEEYTMAIREAAKVEKNTAVAPNGKLYNAQHVWTTMQVFINPFVASLPQHAHLLAGPGCFLVRQKGGDHGLIVNRECDGVKESKPPPEFLPLVLTEQQDEDWEELVKRNIEILPEVADKKAQANAQVQ